MTLLYIVRHGETDWNAAEIFRGRAEVPLNSNGLRQAASLEPYFRTRSLDVVLTSPLERSRQTAAAVARLRGLAPIDDAGLIDIDFGEWQGLPRTEVRRRWPEIYQAWQTAPGTVRFPGGEALSDVRARLNDLLGRVTAYPGGVALVTHRVVAKTLILMLQGFDDSHFWEIRLENAAVTEFELAPSGWKLRGHNLTAHIGSEEVPLNDF